MLSEHYAHKEKKNSKETEIADKSMTVENVDLLCLECLVFHLFKVLIIHGE